MSRPSDLPDPDPGDDDADTIASGNPAEMGGAAAAGVASVGPLATVRAGRAAQRDVGALPVPAATVVLLRPGPDGLEVLLTRRPATMAFAPNVHVFPGGRLDARDAQPGHPLADGLSADEAARRLAGPVSPREALAHFVAAARETMEETGIRVTARDLVPMTRWVTPPSLARRFDVRFFAAAVPARTEIQAPSSEVAEARWLTPDAALAGAKDGTLAMLLPTLVTFEQLVGLPDLETIRAAFQHGSAFDEPGIRWIDDDIAAVDQRWAAGIAGRSAQGWLVGRQEVVLVDPADPTGVTTAAIDAELATRGARIVGIGLTGRRPDQHAGVELYAAGRGLPVVGGVGGYTPYPIRALRPGDAVSFGDVALTAERSSDQGAGALAYLLPDGRWLAPRPDRFVSD